MSEPVGRYASAASAAHIATRQSSERTFRRLSERRGERTSGRFTAMSGIPSGVMSRASAGPRDSGQKSAFATK
jgi:hypothetical protein